MVRTKVFVGNLDFKTKEAELAKAFSAAGKVISANIISRGSRSLGYGFVEMENEEDANKAVQLMNKQELDGRPINVEVAKPREEPPADQQPQQGEAQQQQQAQQGEQQTGSFQRVGGARGGRGRGGFRGGRGRGGSRGGRGGRGGRKGFRVRGEQEAAPANNTAAPQQAQPAQQQQQQEDTRTPSKTTLFVANLPFKLDDEGFGKSLKEYNIAFKSAYVVKNQRSGRSKGFGFIEFENEGDQQKALQALDKKSVDGRELVAKVALTEANAAKTESQTAAPAAKQ